LLTLVFSVHDRQQLARVLRKLRSLPQVMRIQRTRA